MKKFNNRPIGKKKPINTVTFKKSFKSFSEAINDMKNSNEVVAKYLNTEEENPTVENVYKQICLLANDYMPNLTKRENMHWEFRISGNRIFVKTDEFVSFGWIVKSTKVDTDDKSIYENIYNCTITIIGNNPDAIEVLESNGWEKEEEKKYDKRTNSGAN